MSHFLWEICDASKKFRKTKHLEISESICFSVEQFRYVLLFDLKTAGGARVTANKLLRCDKWLL